MNTSLSDFILWLQADEYIDPSKRSMLKVLSQLPKYKRQELWNNHELLDAFNSSGLANLEDEELYNEGMDCIDYIEACGFDHEKHWTLAWNMYMFQGTFTKVHKTHSKMTQNNQEMYSQIKNLRI